MRSLFFVALSAILLASTISYAAQCDMTEVTIFRDKMSTTRFVKRPIYRSTWNRAATFYLTRLRVNTDGAAKSYHPKDPKGQTGLAINNILNGIAVSSISGKSIGNAKKLDIFARLFAANWKPVPGYRVSMVNVMKRNVPRSRTMGYFVPCIDSLGYLVSRTSFLRKIETVALRNSCRGDYFYDAVTTPHFVLPGGSGLRTINHGAGLNSRISKGDLGVFFYPKTEQIVYAIAADIGPPDKLGEGSVNLDFHLKCVGPNRDPGCKQNPQALDTYASVLTLDIPEGVHALVFPRSTPRKQFDIVGSTIDWPITNQKFKAYAEKLFQKWGGGSLPNAIERLKACGKAAQLRQSQLN